MISVADTDIIASQNLLFKAALVLYKDMGQAGFDINSESTDDYRVEIQEHIDLVSNHYWDFVELFDFSCKRFAVGDVSPEMDSLRDKLDELKKELEAVIEKLCEAQENDSAEEARDHARTVFLKLGAIRAEAGELCSRTKNETARTIALLSGGERTLPAVAQEPGQPGLPGIVHPDASPKEPTTHLGNSRPEFGPARLSAPNLSNEYLSSMTWYLEHQNETREIAGKWVVIGGNGPIYTGKSRQEVERKAEEEGLSLCDVVIDYVEPISTSLRLA